MCSKSCQRFKITHCLVVVNLKKKEKKVENMKNMKKLTFEELSSKVGMIRRKWCGSVMKVLLNSETIMRIKIHCIKKCYKK